MLLRKKLSFHNLFLWDDEGSTSLTLSASASPPRAVLPLHTPSTGSRANSSGSSGGSGGSPHYHRHMRHLQDSKIQETMCGDGDNDEGEEGRANGSDNSVDGLQQLVYFRFKKDTQSGAGERTSHEQQKQQQLDRNITTTTMRCREVDPSSDKEAATGKWHWMGYEDSDHVQYILSQYAQFLNLGKSTQQPLFIGSVKRIPTRDHSCDSGDNNNNNISSSGSGSGRRVEFSRLCTVDTVKVYEQDLTMPIGGTQSYIGSHHVLTEWNEDGCIESMERISSRSEYEGHLQILCSSINNEMTLPETSHLYCLPVFDAAIDRFVYLASVEDILAVDNSLFASPRRWQCDSGSSNISSSGDNDNRNIDTCRQENRLGLPYAGSFHFLLSMGQSNDCLEREEQRKMQRLNRYVRRHHSQRMKSHDSKQDHRWRQWTENDYVTFDEEELCYDVEIDDYDDEDDYDVDDVSDSSGECGTIPCSAPVHSDQLIEFEYDKYDDSNCDEEFWWSDDEATFAVQVPTVDHGEEDRDWYHMEPQMQLNSHLSSTYRIIRSSSFPSAHHADEIFLFSGCDGITETAGFQV